MTLNKFRSFLYGLGKFLGDVQAVRSPRKGSIERRLKRRLLGKLAGKLIGRAVR